jgi:hypothetical protein
MKSMKVCEYILFVYSIIKVTSSLLKYSGENDNKTFPNIINTFIERYCSVMMK